ncbi:acyl-CoA dehydrogenase-like protein [Catenaria anguillulae PL171]|uniref:Acyl-CoA dehydrogenase-like protein n=1 Tax=Catenaria anguillulae PL171 TaxID=765915 RepID=A0A1Y2HVR4_9FUNG|nr:acyl-CoA dehydrogenase-like protein [Catenaria anguillulae PL171]
MNALANLSPRARELYDKLADFNECIPAEKEYEAALGTGAQRWTTQPAIMEHLKSRAKALGLWNLFLPREHAEGAGLTNLEYACLAELTGRSPQIAPEATNCSAPDTGNMELLAKYGSPEQKERWLKPLLDGTMRSAFAMTEKNVASSDALNIETTIERVGDEYVVNGHKWYISGAGHPHFGVWIVLGKRDDANHGHFEVKFTNVRVPAHSALVLGEGRGFEVIQGRLGPGRVHHCCRSLGMAERALELGIVRVRDRGATFGQPLASHGVIRKYLADARMKLDQARLLVWYTADAIDRVGAKGALKEIAMIKVVVPNVACEVVDSMIQLFGAAGVSQDTVLPYFYAGLRTLRIADGPDEVHTQQIGRLELRRYDALKPKQLAGKL